MQLADCFKGVLYASTTAPGAAGFALLDRAVLELLHCVGEEPSPSVLWSLRYEQSQSALDTPASASPSVGGILRFPQSSLDLAFDDGMLERVKKVWLEIVGSDAGEFMKFGEQGDGGGGEDDEEA